MCGIIGVTGRDAAKNVFNGLRNLEYRGYDSWGIAFPEGKKFILEKRVGKIGKASFDAAEQEIAIGHTRWATHGKVTEANAHPHLSMDGKIAIVHNGIIENYSQLKEKLGKEGFEFKSETDTEVIANLIQQKIAQGYGFEEAVRNALLELEGYYAVVVMGAGENKIICAKNGSPLVLGIGENENYVASDATAFISETKKAVFMEDNTMAAIGNGIKLSEIKTGKQIPTIVKELDWDFEQAKKGEYEHFMLKEIFEQPNVLSLAAKQPETSVQQFVQLLKNAKNIYLIGCGTSYHACISGSWFFNAIANRKTEYVLASEFAALHNFLDKDSLVIALSQSGETADLIEAIKTAKEKGAKIASIVNVMDSTLMRISDTSLLMNAGPEICVLSTKSYTMQLALLLILAYSLAGKDEEGKLLLQKASDESEIILERNNEAMKNLAKKISSNRDIFTIGRKEAFPIAMESALKIKEVSYIHAEGFAGGELKHGTIALVEEGTPAIALITPSTRADITSNAIEMKSRGAFVIGIDSIENKEFDVNVEISDLGIAAPIALILPIQLLAYHLALEKGLDPDKPRNLAKSVTVK